MQKTLFPPLHKPSSALHLSLPSSFPPLARSSRSPRSPSFLYDELLGGLSVWQEALSLIRDEKKKKRKTERKEEDGEGG